MNGAFSGSGRVLLEVHRDICGKVRDLDSEVRGMIEKAGIPDKINWQKADMVIKEKSGIEEDITL